MVQFVIGTEYLLQGCTKKKKFIMQKYLFIGEHLK